MRAISRIGTHCARSSFVVSPVRFVAPRALPTASSPACLSAGVSHGFATATKTKKRRKTSTTTAYRARRTVGPAVPLTEAVRIMRALRRDESPEHVHLIAILGIDPRKPIHLIKSSCSLPHGTGTVLRVAVFATGAEADAAREAGADIVGMEDLIAASKSGELDVDRVLTAPKFMPMVAQVGRFLGPRGLMPSLKQGTLITGDMGEGVRTHKTGQVQFESDAAGIVRVPVGPASFSEEQIEENLMAALVALRGVKPDGASVKYFRNVFVKSSVGPAIRVDLNQYPLRFASLQDEQDWKDRRDEFDQRAKLQAEASSSYVRKDVNDELEAATVTV